jgi:hypothetical protein
MPRHSETTSYNDALVLKAALERILGTEEWYRLKDNRALSTWKKSLDRALKMSNAAIKGTVEIADSQWFSEVEQHIEKGRANVKSSKTILDAISAFSACYMLLSFLQLGLAPNKTGSRGRPRSVPNEWKLNANRTVQYVQSAKQKLHVEFRNDRRPLADKALDPRYRLLRA